MQAISVIGFGVFGLASLIAAGWLLAAPRRAVDAKLIATALLMQILLGLVLLKLPVARQAFELLASGFVRLLDFAAVGTQFLFGSFADVSRHGFTIVLQVLTTIIFFASLSAVLYHLGLMQMLIRGMAWGILKLMRLSGAETLAMCANIFAGQSEAPLVVKPYIAGMTRSELFCVMVGGMATIAGGVMAAYVGMLGGNDPAARQFYAMHLLTASFMSAPAALLFAKLLLPETEEPLTRGQVRLEVQRSTVNVIDAAATGAIEGVKLAVQIGAMLLAFTALIAMLNAPLQWLGGIAVGQTTVNGWLGALAGQPMELSLQTLLGWLMAPVAWLIGVPWKDAPLVGRFIGEKTVINEFVAYLDMSQRLGELQPVSRVIATYALCGFANFSSIAIQIGALGGLAPERRSDVAALGLRSIYAGTLATLMTATIAGVIERL